MSRIIDNVQKSLDMLPIPQLRSLRHERDVREHGAAVTTRPWWNAPGEDSRDPMPVVSAAEGRRLSMSMLVRKPSSRPDPLASWPFA